MIKVLIDVRYLFEKPSGVGTYIKNLTETLIKNYSHQFSFFLLGNEFNFNNISNSRNIEKIITPFSPENHPKADYWYNTEFIRKIKQHKIDVYHATAFMVPFRKLPCKLITTIHDRVAKKLPATLPFLFRHFLNLNVYFAIKFSHTIITVSEFTKNELKEEFKNLPATTPVHNGCIPFSVSLQKKNKRDDKYILYVGNIEPRKGILELLKAYEWFRIKNPLNQEKLIICGKKLWKYNDPFIFSEKSDYKSSITFKGYVSRDELNYLYANSALTIIPSFYEGFGLPVLEAMNSSAPIIINDIPSLNEVGGNLVNKVNVKDKENFANMIFNLLSEKNKSSISLEKYQNHLKNFTWEKCAEKTKEIYENI